MTASPTVKLGRFAARCATEDLPKAAIEKSAFCLLDTFALAVLAADEPTVVAMRKLACALPDGAKNAASIWADGGLAPLSEAVAVNAFTAHAQFHDDSDLSSWTHPGSLIVPVAVAVGEANNADIELVLRGIVSGYGALVWLGADERVARAMIGRGVRTSPTLGTIGAAAAAATVLKLDAVGATHAIGMASSITGGVLEPVRVGSDEWRVQNAQAARGGLLVAQLAAEGLVGAESALTGPKGLLIALAGMEEMPPEWETDPHPESIVSIVAKPYATLGDNMAAAVAAKLVHDDGVDANKVRKVTTRIWRPYVEYPGTSYRGPFDQTAQALASTVFATAAMLVHGELEYDIPSRMRGDQRILQIASKTTIEAEDEGGPNDATVEVEFADGSTKRREAKEAPGTLLYHDREMAHRLVGQRFERAGLGAAAGRGMADAIFGRIDGSDPIPLRDLLTKLTGRT